MGSGQSKKEEVKPTQAAVAKALNAQEQPVSEERKAAHEKLVERIEKQQMDILKAAQAAKAMQQREAEEA